MKYKPWMMNARMWASGIRANKWKIYPGWQQLAWFQTMNTEWKEETKDYFDYTFALLLQRDTGWN